MGKGQAKVGMGRRGEEGEGSRGLGARGAQRYVNGMLLLK